MSKTFGFASGILCPRCGKWARFSTTLITGEKRRGGIFTISCKHCGFRKTGKSLKEV